MTSRPHSFVFPQQIGLVFAGILLEISVAQVEAAMTKLRILSAALLAAGTIATTSACATYGYAARPYDNGGPYQDIQRVAYDNGFREGVRAGEHDGRDGRRYEPSRHDDWRDADDGYHRNYGDRNWYRKNFRTGFEAGYAQGYRRSDDGRYRR